MSRRLAAVLLVLAAATAVASEPALVVRDAWVRAGVGHGAHAATAAYLTIENRGAEADRLVGVSSPVAGAVELHESRVEGGSCGCGRTRAPSPWPRW